MRDEEITHVCEIDSTIDLGSELGNEGRRPQGAGAGWGSAGCPGTALLGGGILE